MIDRGFDVAWLAGILEGEGCFYLRRDKSKPELVVPNITFESTERRKSKINEILSDPLWVARKPYYVERYPNGRTKGLSNNEELWR